MALAGAVGLFFACNQKSPGSARAPLIMIKKITSPTELIGGLEASGRIGDYLLSNGRSRFIVEDAGSATGWGMFGGSLIDLDIVHDPSDPVRGDDRLQEMFYQCELRAFEPTRAAIVNDGSDGKSAILRFTGRDHGIPLIDGAFATQSLGLEMTVDYVLPSEGSTIEIVLRARDVEHKGSRELSCGFVLIRGDGYDEFRDGTGWGRSSAAEVPYVAAAAPDSTSSYLVYRPSGDLSAVNIQQKILPFNVESKNLASGGTIEARFYVSVGQGDVESTLAERRRVLRQPMLRDVKIAVRAPPGSSADVAKTVITILDSAASDGKAAVTSVRPERTLGTLQRRAEPVALLALAPGRYVVTGTYDGRDLARKTIDVGPAAAGSAPVETALEIVPLGELQIETLAIEKTGHVIGPTAAKLTLKLGHDAPPAAPTAFERYIAPSDVVTVAPGAYTAYVSRGPEYELDRQNVTIVAGGAAMLRARVAQVVNTDGWIAADLHVHSTKSVDATAPRALRVLGAIAEGVEILVATEHDMVADYAPLVHALGLDALLRPVSGTEVSPAYGHINGIPLVAETPEVYWRVAWYRYDQSGLFERLLEPAEIVRSLRALGVEYIQLNHPRSGQGVFQYIQLDPATGQSIREFPAADGFEILNSKGGGEFDQTLVDFIGLIKANRRLTGTGVSDAHSIFGLGYARTMIRVPRDDPARVDMAAVYKSLREGRVVALSGPMVTIEARQGTKKAEIGEVLAASGEIALHVHVEAPSWMDVSSYRVLENGEVLDAGPLTGADQDPTDQVVRLDRTFSARVSADAFYMMIVEGTPASRNEPVMGARARTVTNPVFVDADGDGFHFVR